MLWVLKFRNSLLAEFSVIDNAAQILLEQGMLKEVLESAGPEDVAERA